MCNLREISCSLNSDGWMISAILDATIKRQLTNCLFSVKNKRRSSGLPVLDYRNWQKFVEIASDEPSCCTWPMKKQVFFVRCSLGTLNICHASPNFIYISVIYLFSFLNLQNKLPCAAFLSFKISTTSVFRYY